MKVHGHKDAEPDHQRLPLQPVAEIEPRNHRCEYRDQDQRDFQPIEHKPKHEDGHHDHHQHHPRRGAKSPQSVADHCITANALEDGGKAGCPDDDHHHHRGGENRVARSVHDHSDIELAVNRGHQDRPKCAKAAGLCGRRKPRDDRAEHRQHKDQQRGHINQCAQQAPKQAYGRGFFGTRQTSRAPKDVDPIKQDEQQARSDGPGEHIRNRGLKLIAENNQHHRRRDQDRQGATGRDQPRGRCLVIADLDHARQRQQRQQGNRGTHHA